MGCGEYTERCVLWVVWASAGVAPAVANAASANVIGRYFFMISKSFGYASYSDKLYVALSGLLCTAANGMLHCSNNVSPAGGSYAGSALIREPRPLRLKTINGLVAPIGVPTLRRFTPYNMR